MRSRSGLFVAVAAIALLVAWLARGRHADVRSPAPARAVATGSAHSAVAARHGEGRRIAGTALLEGKAAGGVTIRLAQRTGPIALARAITDARGAFDLGDLPLGTYAVIAERRGSTGAALTVDLRDPSIDTEDITLALHACTATIHGTVRDVSGGVIAGARVAVSVDDDLPGVTAESDAAGAYELCADAGDLRLLASADGYATAGDILTAGGRQRRDFVLEPEGVVEGTVVRAADHAPVPNATVSLLSDWDFELRSPTTEAVSDAEGHFRVAGAAVGRHVIVASATDLVAERPTPVFAEVGKVQDDLVVELVAAVHVRGHVLQHGKPLAGAQLSLESTRFGDYWVHPHAVSAEDGRFDINDLLPGPYTLAIPEVMVPGQAKRLVVPARGLDDVRIEVAELGSIAGTVTRGGAPVDGATVTCNAASDTTDAAGHYELRGVAAGTCSVYAEAKRVGAFSHGPAVTLRDAEHKTGVDIELNLAASIDGTVVDQRGAPVAGVGVYFEKLHDRDRGNATTDEAGHFTATALSGGGPYTYTVHASLGSPALAFADKHPAMITVTDGSTHVTGVVIRVKRDVLAIAGHVVDSRGQPVPDASVTASMPGTYWMLGTATTDTAGHFAIADLPKDAYVVRAVTARGADAAKQVNAGDTSVVLQVADAGRIEGTLVGFTDRPAVVASNAVAAHMYTAYVKGDHFTLEGLPAGDYVISVTSAQAAERTSVHVAAGATATAVLRPRATGTITGRVVAADTGAPVADAMCYTMQQLTYNGPPSSDDQGRFELGAITPGPAKIECIGRDGHGEVDTTVTAGTSIDVVVKVTKRVRTTLPDVGFTVEHRFDDEVVATVEPGGPAERAGIQVGDALVEIDGSPIPEHTSPVAILQSAKPGTTIALTLERDDQRIKASLVVGPPR